MKRNEFRDIIYSYYTTAKREFPFRETTDPYRILVSEIMLQQTQTARVVPKYEEFIRRYPDFESLMRAELGPLLTLWKGLGYNRRAKALRETAAIVVTRYKGELPSDPAVLRTFPGIGPATAASIAAFAYNIPTVFVEVNIRRVYIHFFFPNRNEVPDSEILPFVEYTLDRKGPREWYYALMDYGAMLKTLYPDLAKKSRHYTKQKPFEGSNRQMRGKILGMAAESREITVSGLAVFFTCAEGPVEKALEELRGEGFLRKKGEVYTISE